MPPEDLIKLFELNEDKLRQDYDRLQNSPGEEDYFVREFLKTLGTGAVLLIAPVFIIMGIYNLADTSSGWDGAWAALGVAIIAIIISFTMAEGYCIIKIILNIGKGLVKRTIAAILAAAVYALLAAVLLLF